MKTYNIKYIMSAFGEEKNISVVAKDCKSAYDFAVYEKIVEIEGSTPYGAFVSSYTTKSGNHHIFTKNMYGKAY